MGKRTVAWKDSIVMKHLILFAGIIAVIVFLTSWVQLTAMEIARDATFEKMNTQTEYYLNMLDKEFSHMCNVQVNFFSDRKLMYIADPKISITDYEKREVLLSIKERLGSVDGISSLNGDITLYVPKSKYVITSSGIRRMKEDDWKQVREYYELKNGIFHENDTEFFVLENGTAKDSNNENTNYILIITYPKNKIMDSIQGLEDRKGGGAFFYSEEYGVLQGNYTEKSVAEEILLQMKKDSEEEYISNQNVTVNGERYLVFVDKSDILGTFFQFSKEQAILQPVIHLREYMYLAWICIAVLAFLFVCYTRRMIHKPISKLLDAFERMKSGKFDERIYHDGKDEFSYLYDGFNEMEEQMDHLINEVLLQKDLIQRTELKQLQAQINPHFLYNSFFVLSRRVRRRDYEGAEIFASLLGNYFKFLTRNGTDFIELSKEVEHAKCYAEIQGTRFRQRLEIQFAKLPQEYETLKVPRLILQPLLENSFEHGLENKMQDGILKISFKETANEFQIHIEDNGEELTGEHLEMMRNSLTSDDNGEITGIINIHKRLQIYFLGNAGLCLERSKLGGLDICVWIRGQKDGKIIDC